MNEYLTKEYLDKIMNQKGPIVKAVLLKTGGEVKQIDYDATPKANQVQQIIQAPPTMIGNLNVYIILFFSFFIFIFVFKVNGLN